MKRAWISNLKQVRNSKNLSLEYCSNSINVPIEFLINLEKGKFRKLPPAIYTKHHIKNYFYYLNLDPEECLLDYEDYLFKNSRKKNKKTEKIVKKRLEKKRNTYSIYLLVFVFTLTAVYFFSSKNKTTNNSLNINDIEIPTDSNFTNEENFLIENKVLTDDTKVNGIKIEEDVDLIENPFILDFPLKINIEVIGESWIILEDANEMKLYELMQTGAYELIGNPPFKVNIGYSPAVKISINNKEIDLKKFINKSSNSAAFYTIDGENIEKIDDK